MEAKLRQHQTAKQRYRVLPDTPMEYEENTHESDTAIVINPLTTPVAFGRPWLSRELLGCLAKLARRLVLRVELDHCEVPIFFFFIFFFFCNLLFICVLVACYIPQDDSGTGRMNQLLVLGMC